MSPPPRPDRTRPARPASLPPWWLRDPVLFLGLGLLIFVFYANSFHAGLTSDNRLLIAQDTRLQVADWAHVRQIFTTNYWWPLAGNLYRPLTTLSYWFNYSVLGNGERVAGYHVVNLLLHWANVCLVLVLVRRLSGHLPLAALAAALWAVEPVNTEAVTNIVGRADLLATVAILAGGWCYLRAADASGPRKTAWLAALAVISCLGVLAKENAVMICGFLVLYDALWRWPRLPGDSFRARLAAAFREFILQGYIAVVPALLLLAVARYWLLRDSPWIGEDFINNPLVAAAPFPGLMTAVAVLGRYLALLVWPRTLSNDYSYHQIPLFGEPGNAGGDCLAWLSLALVIILLASAFWRHRRHPLYAWGVLFFFVMLLPTSNLLLNIGSIMAERFLYLPSIGFCVVVALALRVVGPPLAGRAAWAPAVVIILALGLRTYARNLDWTNNFSLWKSAVAAAPASVKAHKGYASALWDDGPRTEAALDAAIAQAEAGLAILNQSPIPPAFRDPNLLYDLGIYYRLKGQFLSDHQKPEQSRDILKKALEVLLAAREIDRATNQASRAALLRRGTPADQIADVGSYHIYVQLAIVFTLLKDWSDCVDSATWAQHLAPADLDGYLLAGFACLNSNRPVDATLQYLAAMMLAPKNHDVWISLVKCYEAQALNPFPVVQKGANFTLYETSPLVRQQINLAGARLVRAFEQARLPGTARALQADLRQRYGIPPAAFAQP